MLISCRSIRQAQYIEKKFLLAKVKDTQLVKDKMPYNTVLSKYQDSRTGSTKWSSIDIFVTDTIRNVSFSIDDRKNVFRFLQNEKSAIPYIKEFKRKKASQRIHRYASLAAMATGLFLVSRTDSDNGSPTKEEIRVGNTGAYLFLAGFLNWIGGGLARAVMRRPVPMKAMYAYYFGPFPGRIAKISKVEKKEILKLFKSF